MILLFSFLFSAFAAQPDFCSEADRTYIRLDNMPLVATSAFQIWGGKEGGPSTVRTFGPGLPLYIRVHPSGEWVIASLNNGSAVLIDIRDKNNPKIIETPLKNEAAPVEPNWDFISSPYAEGGMDYYSFDDLKKLGNKAPVIFSDRRHNEYYQSSAEIPGSKLNDRKFRTVLFATLSSREYRVKKVGEGKFKADKGSVKYLCENIDLNLTQPNLSKDGRYLVGNVQKRDQGNMWSQGAVILNISKPKCTIEDTIPFISSKAAFSHSKSGDRGYLTFTAGSSRQDQNGNVYQTNIAYVYDRNSKKLKTLSQPWLEDAGPPQFTKDNRVIYPSVRKGENGSIIGGLVVANLNNLPEVALEDNDLFKAFASCYPPAQPVTAEFIKPNIPFDKPEAKTSK